MDLTNGFQIEQPALFIPWKITPARLRRTFSGHALHRVTDGYFTTSCVSLGRLSHQLGFHFERPLWGWFGFRRLKWLEFFRTSNTGLEASYAEFQSHLEGTFGKPTQTIPAEGDFQCHFWELPGACVVHSVVDQHVLSERVSISVR